MPKTPAIHLAALILAVGASAADAADRPRLNDWQAYGRTVGGDRHSPLSQINVANVKRLKLLWRLSTGEAPLPSDPRRTRFEATPLALDGVLYFSTPRGQVIAVDGATGRRRWTYAIEVDPSVRFGDYASRGVSYWSDARARRDSSCRDRIFTASVDARLIALDAKTGAVCPGFGVGGIVDLRHGLRNPPFEPAEYEVTSPPAVIGDVLVVGSAVADNNRTDAASGEVRGLDARTGRVLWTWDPVPQDPRDPAYGTWVGAQAHRTGGANVWSVIAADAELGLVYLPTSSPSPDYFGGERAGDNRYANSIVALEAKTGRLVWSFQTVHHDLWDYDNASPPALIVVGRHGHSIPAVVQATKTGQLFVLDRRTGAPIFPVEERPTPASDVPGEHASATQPFSVGLPFLSPLRISEKSFTPDSVADPQSCLARLRGLRNDGPFTPPSLGGTLVIPSNVGGGHWGGVSFDPRRQILVVPTNHVAAIVRLFDSSGATPPPHAVGERIELERTRMRGTPYTMQREMFVDASGESCAPGPAGSLHAISLTSGKTVWDVPIGEPQLVGGREITRGNINLGGPVTTAGGVTFLGADGSGWIRAFETATGRVLWKHQLTGMARATPMTFGAADGRQLVAIAVGRSGRQPDDELWVFGLSDTP